MNARGEFVYSMLWLIKPKIYNTNQYYADNHLIIICISIPKDSVAAGREIKNNKHTFSEGHRFWVGLLASLHSTVQVHPC
jgi:hypothetical protein